jgi:hypothetical protein
MLGQSRVVRWAPIPEEHQRSYAEVIDGSPRRPVAIVICEHAPESCWYSFHCDKDWRVIYDGWHMSDDEARTAMEDSLPGMAQAWRTDVLADD